MEDLGASEDLPYQEYPVKILETSESVTPHVSNPHDYVNHMLKRP
jgi:hypothetical protein